LCPLWIVYWQSVFRVSLIALWESWFTEKRKKKKDKKKKERISLEEALIRGLNDRVV